MTTFRDIYLKVMKTSQALQKRDGSMPAGCNGPHHDPETPVRNTSHYIIAFLRAWELSGDGTFFTAAERCIDYLINDNPFRGSYNFHYRNKQGKDHCNGLIGPAWTIEALLYASDKFEHAKARKLARNLFLLHKFDRKAGAWRRIEPDGKVLSIDSTFNHQLWFAACAAPLCYDTPEAADHILRFLEMLKENWALARNGRIIHPVWLKDRRRRESIKRLIKPSYRKDRIAQEVGYHAFNLYAFAMLHEAGMVLLPSEAVKLKKAVGYLNNSEFCNMIDHTKYGFPYNPPGYEVPYALIVLAGSKQDECRIWLERQLVHSFDRKTNRMSLRNDDSNTQTARIYEAARLPNNFFELEVI